MNNYFGVNATEVTSDLQFTAGSGSLAGRFNSDSDGRWLDWLCEGTGKLGAGADCKHATIVNEQSAIGWAPLWRAFNIMASYVAKLPFNLYDRGFDDARERADTHPVFQMMRWQPHPMINAYNFRKTIQYHAERRGNGYAYISRIGSSVPGEGQPSDLTILDPRPKRTYPVIQFNRIDDATEFHEHLTDGLGETEVAEVLAQYQARLWYVTNGHKGISEQRKLPAEDVLHIKGLSDDGLCGHDVIETLKSEIALGIQSRDHKYHFYASGGVEGGILMFPGGMNPEKQKDTMKYWNQVRSGPTAFTRVAKLSKGTTYEPNNSNSRNSQTNETREFQIAMASNITGVPQHMLGGKRINSYNSIEAEDRRFLNDALDDRLCGWEFESRDKLLTTEEKADGMYFQFDRSRLQQPSLKETMEAGEKAVNGGLILLNDWLKRNNWPKINCPEADMLRMPLNIGFCGDRAGEMNERQLDKISAVTEKQVKLVCNRVCRDAAAQAGSFDKFQSFLSRIEEKHRNHVDGMMLPINALRSEAGLKPVPCLLEQIGSLLRTTVDEWVSSQSKLETAEPWIDEKLKSIAAEIPRDWPPRIAKQK